MSVMTTGGILLVTILYLASLAMAGKCSGRWAIHACGGGNGKRSEGDDYKVALSSDELAVRGLDKEMGEQQREEEEEEDRSRSLLSRLTSRLSSRDHLPQPMGEQLYQDDVEISESEERPLWNAGELLAEIARDNRGMRRVDDGASLRDNDRAELQAALRLIKRLQARSAKLKLNDIIGDSP